MPAQDAVVVRKAVVRLSVYQTVSKAKNRSYKPISTPRSVPVLSTSDSKEVAERLCRELDPSCRDLYDADVLNSDGDNFFSLSDNPEELSADWIAQSARQFAQGQVWLLVN
jgi:hypothetical protein